MKTYDLIIIGGGPTGINCSIEAQKASLSHLVIEKGTLANSIYNFPNNMTFFSTSKLLEIAETPFISHTDKPTRKEALDYYRSLVLNFDLPFHFYEEVIELKTKSQKYFVETKKAIYGAKNIIVATGFYDQPVMLHIEGETLPKVKHYYDDAHIYVGQDVLVIGAANSACDVALETWQKGANVSMAIRGSEINNRVKYWIKPNIENRIKEKSITAYFETAVKKILEHSVLLYNEQRGAFELKNDYVLAMTGYKPNYNLLEKLGIQFQNSQYKEPIHDPETLETNLSNVYIAGVINGGLKTNRYFIENTRHHAEIIVKQIVKKNSLCVQN